MNQFPPGEVVLSAGSDEPGVELDRPTTPETPASSGSAEWAAERGEFLTRCLAFLLRHGAAKYRVELDPEGWASLDAVARALRRLHPRFRALPMGGLAAAMPSQSSERFEVHGGRIRALYGHSVRTVIPFGPLSPPEVLFHGTWDEAEESIKGQGLRPMGRSYVHLTSDLEYAERVARAAGTDWVVFRVRTGEASRSGVIFRRASRSIWLAGEIAPQFIEPTPALRGTCS